MRLAWFRASSADRAADPGAWAACLPLFSAPVQLDRITESRAHDFLVAHTLGPYDLCVYEPRNTPDSAYIWPYLFRFPGVLLLQDQSLHDARIATLERHRRSQDYEAEFRFNHGHGPRGRGGAFPRGRWPMLRAALVGSRLTVVPHDGRRRHLLDACPALAVTVVGGCAPHIPRTVAPSDGPRRGIVVRAAAHDTTIVNQAAIRAATADAPMAVSSNSGTGPDAGAGDAADVMVLLGSLYEEEPISPLLAALSKGLPVVAYEREALAHIPALDPQTWQPRPGATEPPALITIDPRDAEHSLSLALRRLASDPVLRQTVGDNARRWWGAHATPEQAAAGLQAAFVRALALDPLPRPDDWPAHLIPQVGLEFDMPASCR